MPPSSLKLAEIEDLEQLQCRSRDARARRARNAACAAPRPAASASQWTVAGRHHVFQARSCRGRAGCSGTCARRRGARSGTGADRRCAVPLEVNLAGGRLVDAGQQVEDRRLARAVRTDQTVDFALPDVHVQLVDGDETAEANRALSVREHDAVAVRHSRRARGARGFRDDRVFFGRPDGVSARALCSSVLHLFSRASARWHAIALCVMGTPPDAPTASSPSGRFCARLQPVAGRTRGAENSLRARQHDEDQQQPRR